jgi:hypothetical protein
MCRHKLQKKPPLRLAFQTRHGTPDATAHRAIATKRTIEGCLRKEKSGAEPSVRRRLEANREANEAMTLLGQTSGID